MMYIMDKNKLRYTEGDSRPPMFTRRELLIRECRATRADGEKCRRYAVKGEAFCRSHLEQGYALFTLAAVRNNSYDRQNLP